jgi:glycine/D-amino acid oxidase-like deaminating enzyme
VDDGPTAGGETCRTTAHLVTALDDRFYHLDELHGRDASRLAAESHAAAIDAIERIARDEMIACDFSRLDGYLIVPPDDDVRQLDRELEAAHRAGLVDVVRVDRAPIAFDTGPALRFPRQGQFHILKYLKGVAAAAKRQGARIHNGTRAISFSGGNDARVETDRGVVTASAIVVATNTPVNDRVAIHTKQAAYRTFVVGARVASRSVPEILLWDTPDPYHYVRIQRLDDQSDVLIVGGEDHKTGQLTMPTNDLRGSSHGRESVFLKHGRSNTAGPDRSWSRSTAWRSSVATRSIATMCTSRPVIRATG